MKSNCILPLIVSWKEGREGGREGKRSKECAFCVYRRSSSVYRLLLLLPQSWIQHCFVLQKCEAYWVSLWIEAKIWTKFTSKLSHLLLFYPFVWDLAPFSGAQLPCSSWAEEGLPPQAAKTMTQQQSCSGLLLWPPKSCYSALWSQHSALPKKDFLFPYSFILTYR